MVLGRGLGAGSDRIKRDASLSLAFAPDLELADRATRAAVLAALRTELAAGGPSRTSLLITVRRLRLDRALDLLVPHFLDDRSPDLRRALGVAIGTLDAYAAIRLIDAQLPADVPGRRRAVDLLRGLGDPRARATLERALESDDCDLRLDAGAALLELGASAADLSELVDEPFAASCVARRRAARPTFRSILQGVHR